MKRRDFLKRVAPMSLLPFAINGQPIRAYGKLMGAEAEDFTATDNVLVLVQLNGGNDGLNTLIPLDQYANLSTARPDVLIPENKVLPLNGISGTGLHPSMSKMKNMYDDGKMHILQSVGYPNPNYSHFRSTDIWMTGADSDEVLESGWLGRYLSEEWPNYPNGFPNEDMEDPLAIQIGSVVSQVCQGLAVNMGFAISNPTNYYQLLTGTYPDVPNTWAGKELGYVRTVARQTNEYSQKIKSVAENTTNLSTLYPEGNRLADQLKIVAQLIAGGLKTRVYIVSQGGFDTHANQVDPVDGHETGYHSFLLESVSEAINAFQDDLEKLKIDDRVLGMTFSEFGRRIISNGSHGTDHGSSAPLFMFGKNIKSGITGTNPTIPVNASANDNLEMQTDFRSIYSTILQDWFCLDEATSDSVLLHDFDKLDLVEDSCKTTSVQRLRNQKAGDAYVTNYPNPFGDHTSIKYYSDGGLVYLEIIDTQGKTISTLVNSQIPRGTHEVNFDAMGLPSGTYYCKYQNGMIAQTRSLLKVR
ncbi:MAG: hypothetical protein COA58_06580 [Bacteroidetes bacterium]|nr:MAG: hypothetical protein COA58_06580 [Bacteroidota bacterium]